MSAEAQLSEGGSDTHHYPDKGDGFRERLNPSGLDYHLDFFCRTSRCRKLICPSCQRVAGGFACDVGQITSTFPASRARKEGRIAIVTDVGRGMRWTLKVFVTKGTEADGEVVASWHPDAGVKLLRS